MIGWSMQSGTCSPAIEEGKVKTTEWSNSVAVTLSVHPGLAVQEPAGNQR